MIQVLFGTERYKIDMLRSKVIKEVPEDAQAFDLARFEGGFTEDVAESCKRPPIFSERRVIVLDAPDFKSVNTEDFKNYVKSPAERTDVVIVCDKKPDMRTKAVKAYQKQGILKACDKVKTEAELEKILLYEAKKAGAKVKESGMRELTSRLSYFEVEDMNLLKAISYLRNAIDYGDGVVTAEAVNAVVPKIESKDIFGTASLLRDGDMDALLRQTRLIKPDEAIGAASALLRDFRISYKRKMFSLQEVGAYREPVFKDADEKALLSCLDIVTDEIRGVKEGYVRAEDLLQEVFNRTFIVLHAPAAAE